MSACAAAVAAAALEPGVAYSAASAVGAAVAEFGLVPVYSGPSAVVAAVVLALAYLTESVAVVVAAEPVLVCLVSSAVVSACPVDLTLSAGLASTSAE